MSHTHDADSQRILTPTAMNHVPPPNIWAVGIIGSLYELSSFPIQDAPAVWKVRLPPFPVTLHDLVRSARTTLHVLQNITSPSLLRNVALLNMCGKAAWLLHRHTTVDVESIL